MESTGARGTPKNKNMKPQQTTAQPPVDLDATDKFPVFDPTAYEAEVLSREPAGSSDSSAITVEPDPSATGTSTPDRHLPGGAPPAVDSDVMSAVEHWIAQKSEELRAHHDALSLLQRERNAAVGRADALSCELAETTAKLEALSGRERTQLSELETRLRDSEAREGDARRTVEAQHHAHAELTQRVERETGDRERLAAEVAALQAQLSSCVESLHSRESYRTLYESTLHELEAELAVVMLRAGEQEARANQLEAELQSRGQRLQDVVRERDGARQLRDAEIAQRTAERGEGERRHSALESRLAALTAEHADTSAQLLATKAELTTARQHAEAEALASATAAGRGRELESAIASRQAELTDARLEIERNRTLLADLTAALLKSQTMFSDQSRVLEERDAAAGAMAAAHAAQAALIASLHGQIEELSARLATPDVERRALEERVAALTKEVAQSDSRITRLESMNADLRATVGQLDALLAERDAEVQRTTQIASINAQALGRVQSSIDELGRTLTASDGASAQGQVSILTRIDSGQNHSVVLRGRTTIGRDRDNDLALAMRSVSRHHAVLIPAFRTAFIQDLSSTNGVRVNERRVRCARLEHGDVITVGEAQFRYTVASAPAGAVSTGSTLPGSTRASLKHAS